MSEVDDAIRSARASWDRIGSSDAPAIPSARRRNTGSARRRLTRIVVADAAILIAAFVVGLIVPLGIIGTTLVMVLLIATTLALAILPDQRPAPSPDKLRAVELKALPAQTGRWLSAQRQALPAPAITLVDQIGLRLDALGPQLARVEDDTPDAADLRRLIGEQLPAFVADYQRVPAPLRGVPRNGRTPDAELVAGLKVIDQEIGDMTNRLAQGDLDSLATRGRYLEIKYRGDGEPG
ncbi:hypothetical protein ASE75_09910 [Sphingomonas sp. Leaf17]|uniref:hypothetical protein n=1 Tax=Sphingomonas sp. Leaf17 TaxID=1735683 RepID=UPI000700D6BB|nr:hypothetical protein [Sphingomonas sp. Leaf17]KQM64292.1 hypothetical protein ASE75_09910 [Sphingomonas sp. Leaf17]